MIRAIEIAPVQQWLIDLLGKGTGRPVGDMDSPIERPKQSDFPYAIVDYVTGTFSGPVLSAPEADGELVFTVRSIGLRPDQARFLSDRVRLTMLARDDQAAFQVQLENPSGYEIQSRESTAGGPGVPIEEAQYTPTVYTIPERFTIRVTGV